MDDGSKGKLVDQFDVHAPIMDIETCAKVYYRPFKDNKAYAWLPIGWETHQPVLFVMAQDEQQGTVLNAIGEREVFLSMQSYANMSFLSLELRRRIRQELGLDKSG